MPINFPDGVLCREPGSRRRAPLQPPATWDGRGYETARDTDLLAAWRTLREHPAAVASRITRATCVRGVARYSDRGAARPHLTAGAFAASEHCTLRVGENGSSFGGAFPGELVGKGEGRFDRHPDMHGYETTTRPRHGQRREREEYRMDKAPVHGVELEGEPR